MDNSNQYNNNSSPNQQPTNIFTNNNTQPKIYFNQPSKFTSNEINTDLNNGFNNLSPIQQQKSQSIDPVLLNGTNLDDEPNFNPYFNHNNLHNQDPTLIKSVAREIINGLKENNMSLYDNSSINSYRGITNKTDDYDINDDIELSDKYKKSNNKVKEIVETIEDFVNDKDSSIKTYSTKTYSEHIGWFFDECFNYKDFLVLFILYFVLSQEMIKDFFAKYFSSLNADYEGKIGVQGVIVYGLILCVLFMIIRKLF
jgi:hypothetical protein